MFKENDYQCWFLPALVIKTSAPVVVKNESPIWGRLQDSAKVGCWQAIVVLRAGKKQQTKPFCG